MCLQFPVATRRLAVWSAYGHAGTATFASVLTMSVFSQHQALTRQSMCFIGHEVPSTVEHSLLLLLNCP